MKLYHKGYTNQLNKGGLKMTELPMNEEMISELSDNKGEDNNE